MKRKPALLEKIVKKSMKKHERSLRTKKSHHPILHENLDFKVKLFKNFMDLRKKFLNKNF